MQTNNTAHPPLLFSQGGVNPAVLGHNVAPGHHRAAHVVFHARETTKRVDVLSCRVLGDDAALVERFALPAPAVAGHRAAILVDPVALQVVRHAPQREHLEAPLTPPTAVAGGNGVCLDVGRGYLKTGHGGERLQVAQIRTSGPERWGRRVKDRPGVVPFVEEHRRRFGAVQRIRAPANRVNCGPCAPVEVDGDGSNRALHLDDLAGEGQCQQHDPVGLARLEYQTQAIASTGCWPAYL